MIREKIELLGKGLYKDIPDVLTLLALPTAGELDLVGAEDFDEVMVNEILPKCIEEKINTRDLLEIDYHYIIRCLRLINYGPYIHTPTIFCDKCEEPSRGDYIVNLQTISCIPLPPKFVNELVVKKEEFIDYDKDFKFHLPTIQEALNATKDPMFHDSRGNQNIRFAHICYMCTSIGNDKVDPVTAKMRIQNELAPYDYEILKDCLRDLENYGLRGGGTATCPRCGNPDAAFVTFTNERSFRPALDCLRKWRDDRNQREDKDVPGTKATKL